MHTIHFLLNSLMLISSIFMPSCGDPHNFNDKKISSVDPVAVFECTEVMSRYSIKPAKTDSAVTYCAFSSSANKQLVENKIEKCYTVYI